MLDLPAGFVEITIGPLPAISKMITIAGKEDFCHNLTIVSVRQEISTADHKANAEKIRKMLSECLHAETYEQLGKLIGNDVSRRVMETAASSLTK